MNKEEIFLYLKDKNIKYKVSEHGAVYNMAELAGEELLYPEAVAKNLFVRDDKKRQYYLISVKGDKRVDLKEFRNKYLTRALSFASSADLEEILRLMPGSVSPLGLLNDEEHRVIFYLDSAYCGDIIGCHPNDNTATLWLRTEDLIMLIEEHGNRVELCDL